MPNPRFPDLVRVCLDLLYPRRCPVCEAILTVRDGLVCSRCSRNLPWVEEPRCKKCGRPLLSGQVS